MSKSKIVALITFVVSVVLYALTTNSLDEWSGITQYLLALSLSYSFFVLFDMLILKNVSTLEEILDKRNVAYAILLLIPAILALAAATSL